MASAIYPKYKEMVLSTATNTDLLTGTVKVVLIDTDDYTYSATHEFLSDVAAASRVGTAQTIGTKSVTNGVFDGADVTFPTVSGDQVEALLIYVDTGVEGTSPLVAFIDQDDVTNLPATPTGADIPVIWNSSGIFAL